MKRIKNIIVALAMVFGVGMVAVPVTAYADSPVNNACTAIGSDPNCGSGSGPTVESVIRATVTILSILVGIVAVFMIIISGLKYITSGGDASSVAGAKNTLIYSIVGLIVAGSAYAIVNYVLKSVK